MSCNNYFSPQCRIGGGSSRFFSVSRCVSPPVASPSAQEMAQPPQPKAFPPFNQRRALITGVTGQDGSYLVELLLSKVRTLTPCIASKRSLSQTFCRDFLVILAFLSRALLARSNIASPGLRGSRHCAPFLLLQYGSP